MKKLVLIVFGLAVAGMALAQSRGHGNREGERRADKRELMAEKLNLTDAQKEEMDGVKKEYRGALQGINNELDIKQAELKAAIAKEASQKEIDGLVKEINALNSQKFEKNVAKIIATRSILDDDQKLIFDSMAHRRDGHGRKGGRGRY